ncbi:MAG TPA: cytochrome C oxidase subunit IV family protein [Candidatus Acidoferrales bacterium]|nr:cytochrome C oxidase subunit IV family protein [Candidatus Acidoferrales bacterium]
MPEHAEHSGHVVPVSTYVLVFVALMAGTALTTGVAYIDLGRWNTVAALTIAVIKMILVVLFFMHVKYATGLTRIVILCGFFWLAIMITLSCSDELTRNNSWEIIPKSWNALVPLFSRLF